MYWDIETLYAGAWSEAENEHQPERKGASPGLPPPSPPATLGNSPPSPDTPPKRPAWARVPIVQEQNPACGSGAEEEKLRALENEWLFETPRQRQVPPLPHGAQGRATQEKTCGVGSGGGPGGRRETYDSTGIPRGRFWTTTSEDEENLNKEKEPGGAHEPPAQTEEAHHAVQEEEVQQQQQPSLPEQQAQPPEPDQGCGTGSGGGPGCSSEEEDEAASDKASDSSRDSEEDLLYLAMLSRMRVQARRV